MSASEVAADAYTAPFMLTSTMHRDVYPAVDPATNKAVQATDKVIIITGAAGGLGFVRYPFGCWREREPS